jgi:hypothetical protein
MSMTKILHTFTNAADGVAAEVARITNGFSVVLRDLDSNEVVPVAKVFSDEAKAVAYAKAIVPTHCDHGNRFGDFCMGCEQIALG